MAITLKNKTVKLVIEKAGEKYRGSRFDWNGTIVSARYKGYEILGHEKPVFKRNARLFGRGLQNEFGISQAVGYDECAPGEWFPKIGIGWLKRDDKPYFFYTQYAIDPIEHTCTREGADTVVCTARSDSRNGYAYEYEKTIALENDGFRVHYRLENTGQKKIETDEYVHNFLSPGGKNIGPNCTLSFPWKLDPSAFSELKDPDGIMDIRGKEVAFVKGTKEQFYLGDIGRSASVKEGLAARWTLHDGKGDVSFSEEGSFVPSKVAVWGWTHVISPELFFSISLERGDIVTWERRYRFS